MSDETFESIKRGMEEAIAFARGEKRLAVHEVDMSRPPGVRDIRSREAARRPGSPRAKAPRRGRS